MTKDVVDEMLAKLCASLGIEAGNGSSALTVMNSGETDLRRAVMCFYAFRLGYRSENSVVTVV